MAISKSVLPLTRLGLVGCHVCLPSSPGILSSPSESHTSRACISIQFSSCMRIPYPVVRCDSPGQVLQSPRHPRNTLQSCHISSSRWSMLLPSVAGTWLSHRKVRRASCFIGTIPAPKQIPFCPCLVSLLVPATKLTLDQEL